MPQCARGGMTCHDKQCANCWAILIRFRGLAAPTSLIHLTAQEGCSPKSGCTIVHNILPTSRRTAAGGYPRWASQPQTLRVPDQCAESRMPVYSSGRTLRAAWLRARAGPRRSPSWAQRPFLANGRTNRPGVQKTVPLSSPIYLAISSGPLAALQVSARSCSHHSARGPSSASPSDSPGKASSCLRSRLAPPVSPGPGEARRSSRSPAGSRRGIHVLLPYAGEPSRVDHGAGGVRPRYPAVRE
jgi:hypothetical protein